MGIKAEIMANIATRLGTVKAANGYTTDVQFVYFDKIPMGLELNDYQLPAVFLLDKIDELNTQQAVIEGLWTFHLQLWHNQVPDSDMLQFVRDIFKALYADSPTAQVNGAFRALHPNLVELKPLSISSDLQMIEANRINIVEFQVRYRTKLYDL